MLIFGVRRAGIRETGFEFLIPDLRMKVLLLFASARIKTGDISTNLQTGVKVFQEVFNRVV